MAQVKFLLADPEVTVINSQQQVIFVHGGCSADQTTLSKDHLTPPQTLAHLSQQGSETSIIQLVMDQGKPATLRAWRPIHSKFEIFFSCRANGDVWISDTVRNLVACTPVFERGVPEEHMLDHLLFRRVPLNGCLVRGWRRLGPGECCEIALPNQQVTTSIFDRIVSQTKQATPEDRLEELDSLFSDVMRTYNGKDGVVSLFSGGVDSTLLYTYMDKGSPTITAMTDSLKPHEKETLDAAIDLLGISPDYLPVSSADYLGQLENAIEGFGIPPELDQITFYTNLFGSSYSSYISGTPADSLLGSYPTDGWSGFFMMALVQCGGIGLARTLAPLVPARYRQRYVDMADWAEEFRHGPLDLNGATALEDAFTDFDLLFRAFGKDRVLERLQNRLDQLVPLVERSAPKSDLYQQHMELLHWMGYIAGAAPLQERQYGLAFGKSVIFPFSDRRIVDFINSVPVKDRYLTENRQAKPWPKKLLEKRLPGYPVYAQKGTTQYPMPDFFAKGGPLEHAWEKYDIMSPLKETVEDDFLATWSDLNWNVLGYAIWRDRVIENANLELLPHTKMFGFDMTQEQSQRSDELVTS